MRYAIWNCAYQYHYLFSCYSVEVYAFQEYNAKLSDFGLAKDGPEGDNTHVSTRVMGTHGYAAPEYVMTGEYLTGSQVSCTGLHV